jgi:hypothetical protein
LLKAFNMAKAYKNNDKPDAVNEDDGAMRFYASQEEQELARLKEAIDLSATEKFYRLTRLMKLGNMLKKAKIHHKNV